MQFICFVVSYQIRTVDRNTTYFGDLLRNVKYTETNTQEPKLLHIIVYSMNNSRGTMDTGRKDPLSTPYGSASSLTSPVLGSYESESQFHAARSGVSSSGFSSPDYSETDDESVSKTSSYKSFSTSVDHYGCSRGEREPLLQSRDPASNVGLFNRTNTSESSMQIHHISHEFISDLRTPPRAYSLLSKCR